MWLLLSIYDTHLQLNLTNTMSSNLPEDILHGVTSVLKDDIPSLRAFSLTSRNFTPAAQRHLFHHISLPGKLNPSSHNRSIPPKIVTNLHSILTKNPSLLRYIHDIHIIQISHSPPDQPMMSYSILWILQHPNILVELFNLLESSPIESFTLLFHEPANLKWSNLNPSLCTALQNLFRKPTLRELRLEGFSVPPQLFFHCVGVESLALINVSTNDDQPIQPPSPSTPHPLHKVKRLYYTPSSSDNTIDFSNPTGSFNLNELNFLWLNLYNLTRISSISNLFHIRNLTELHIKPASYSRTPPRIDLTALVNLVKLTLSFDNGGSVDRDSIGWIDHTLSSLPTAKPSLRTFVLRFSAPRPNEVDLQLYHELSEPLGNAHRRLRGVLKQVLVLVRFSGHKVAGTADFARNLTQQLVWEGSQEVLTVDAGIVPWVWPMRITAECKPLD
ncbi:hypothetical protein BDN72DRAFT_881148 [Pluteus cervinus]|uniref:Uncharacterized protein n=1 Tax=Pluteus cervinus TaxID=181527 RepID=A0ACD3AHF4_9AGAR|nr:hypothetical protein BDN72DRAFT_881148 [Pluteus cervinus]